MLNEKSYFRASMRLKCAAMDPAWRLEASQLIAKRIIEMEMWRAAKVIGLFAGRKDEPEPSVFWPSEKMFVYPKVVGLDLQFYEVKDFSDLKTGAFGLLEPIGNQNRMPDLILVPGVAFDAKGGRLGRGKGFYDRWLWAYPHVATMGLCFDFQIVEQVPLELHDGQMDCVITEKRIYQK